MALMKVKGNLERLFDKNLNDLVRGIRNNRDDEAKYIAQCLEEIKLELRQHNPAVKANAVAKLTYLQMLGYDISWAGFNVIEVMSSGRFTEKRVGYLAAAQSFRPDTDVLMLTTNMIRKDLNSHNQYDAGVALSSLACFISPDLARDLSGDIMTLLTSTKPYLRKKAVLILYKVFLRYPEALRPAFPRLREKLEDPDPGVQSAAVNVVCELARKNPKNYLSLAPTFFKLMTTSTNNWMLIKIIKLFGALTPLEPRLGKKLIEPLTSLIHSTSAMSLLYECINTVIAVLISISSGMPNHTAAVQLCVQKLRILIEDSDQNLKYLGLLAMSKILRTHPKSVQGHKDLVMKCLDDSDESIRLRALDLLYGMVNKKSLMEIVKKLMAHMDKAEGTTYRDELMEKIIKICSQNDYAYITNFEWYISVLVELTRMESGGSGGHYAVVASRHGYLLAAQMLDVAIRVEAVRSFAVAQMALLVENAHVLAANGGGLSSSGNRGSTAEVLYAACWICGEFADRLQDPVVTLEAMMFRAKVTAWPGHIQAVVVQNAMKLYAHIAKNRSNDDNGKIVRELGEKFKEKLKPLLHSSDLEVQERASTAMQMIVLILAEGDDSVPASELALLFQGELNPVGPKAQKKVPVPEGLDLESWINEPPPSPQESGEESDESIDDQEVFVKKDDSSTKDKKDKKHKKKLGSKTKKKGKKDKDDNDPTPEDLKRAKEARLLEQSMNPNYLKDNPRQGTAGEETIPPVQTIDLGVPLHVPGIATADQYLNISRDSSVHGGERNVGEIDSDAAKKSKKKKKKKRRRSSTMTNTSEEGASTAPVVVSKNLDMPEGAIESEDEGDGAQLAPDDPHRALADVRLDDIEFQEPYKPKDGSLVQSRQSDADVPEVLFGSQKKKKLDVKTDEVKEKKKKKKKNRDKEKDKSKDLFNGEGEVEVTKKKKKKKKSKETSAEETQGEKSKVAVEIPGADDVDFWLSSEVTK